MVNVLLNYYNFHESWTAGKLDKYFRNKRVLIIPLAFRESQVWDNYSWQTLYGKGGEKYDNILRPFLYYGNTEEEIKWLNCYDCSTDFHRLISDSEVLFFTGGMPEKAIRRLCELGVAEDVKNFVGVVAGASAGAMLQLDTYHITPDEDYDSYSVEKGLGLVHGFDLEVHYLNTELQNECTKRAVRQLNVPVYQMWHEGGIVVEDGVVTTLGNVQKISK